MKNSLTFLIFLISLQLAQQAKAFTLDINLNNFDDKLTTSSESKSSRLFGSVGVLADLSKNDSARVTLGWYVMSVTQKNEMSSTFTENLSAIDTGPALRWAIDSKKVFALTAIYGVISKAQFETATTSQNLTGTSYCVKLSVEPEVVDHFNLGFALNYYSSEYTRSVLNSAESTISYKNSWLFPSISMALSY
jgi:hypothetical protein